MPDSSEAKFLCDPRRSAARLPAVGSRVHLGIHAAARREGRRALGSAVAGGSFFLPTADFSAIKIWSYGHVG